MTMTSHGQRVIPISTARQGSMAALRAELERERARANAAEAGLAALAAAFGRRAVRAVRGTAPAGGSVVSLAARRRARGL